MTGLYEPSRCHCQCHIPSKEHTDAIYARTGYCFHKDLHSLSSIHNEDLRS